MKIAFIDHYDSFSFNIINWLKTNKNIEIFHIYYDDNTSIDKLICSPLPTILGPGPKAPKDIKSSFELTEKLLNSTRIFGICLGHQILASVFGASIIGAENPHHGSTQDIKLLQENHEKLPKLALNFQAMSYNSLVIKQTKNSLKHIIPLAVNNFNEIQIAKYSNPNAFSYQFHAESFKSEQSAILANLVHLHLSKVT